MSEPTDRPQQPAWQKPIIGIIGGIGSGKSAVAAEFARHGAAVISGDQLGHEALRQPKIRAEVVQQFGKEILNSAGQIERRTLGAMVFADRDKLRALEKLVFPWIGKGIRGQAADAQADSAVKFIVVDAAVMLEAGWNNFCDKLVYVDVPAEQRVARLVKQRGWKNEEVEARTQAQMPLADKAARADAVIDNSGSPQALAGQIARLLIDWRIPVAFGADFVDNT